MDSIDWDKVNRVLVVRLRSIGDTVLTTPALLALRRFLPEAQIDILLEDWVAPVLDGFESVDNVLIVENGTAARVKAARRIRKARYDVVFNMHGGTTGTFFAVASGATHRVGYSHYQYTFFYNHLLSSAADFWQEKAPHSAEQHLALLGFLGVPVDDRPKSHLSVTESANQSIEKRLSSLIPHPSSFVLLHPAAAFATKQWASEHFARTADFLAEKGLQTVAIAAKHESEVLEKLSAESSVPIIAFDDLSLPEITALAAKARLFVGNDSGIAHIAAAVNLPSVVIFGSSNRTNWRPWTDAPNEIVYEPFPCQPCPGYVCKEFGEPKCILSVKTESVFEAIDRVLNANKL